PLLPAARPGAVIPRGKQGDDRRVPPAIRPIPHSVILTDRPEFSWPDRPGARAYRVRLVDGVGRTVWERRTDRCILPCPADERPLDLSREYAWSVTTRVNDCTEVHVLDNARFQTMPRLLAPTFQQLRAFGASDDPADVVLSAILLRDLDA